MSRLSQDHGQQTRVKVVSKMEGEACDFANSAVKDLNANDKLVVGTITKVDPRCAALMS